jgi:hypothetical protein
METLYLGVWCEPFHDYWAVPTPNIQCSAAIHHLIVNAVFNISSDLALIAVALNISIGNQLSVLHRVFLSIIFGLGIFTVLSAVLNKYYSFTHPFGLEWTYWYVRESSTAMIVSNLPFTWNLLRRLFRLAAFNRGPEAVQKRRLQQVRRVRDAREADTLPDNYSHDDSPPRSFRLLDIAAPNLPQMPLPTLRVPRTREPTTLEGPGIPDWRGVRVYGRQEALASGMLLDEDQTLVHDEESTDERTVTPESVIHHVPAHYGEEGGEAALPDWFTRKRGLRKSMLLSTPHDLALELTESATWML